MPPGLEIYKQLYSNDSLWDGKQCGWLEEPCCTSPNMLWFMTTLNETTSEEVELRICGNEQPSDEDTPLED